MRAQPQAAGDESGRPWKAYELYDHNRPRRNIVRRLFMAEDETETLKTIIEVLFLNLSWDARQYVKRILTDHQKIILTEVVARPDGSGEINW
jgi:hypothetical protein